VTVVDREGDRIVLAPGDHRVDHRRPGDLCRDRHPSRLGRSTSGSVLIEYTAPPFSRRRISGSVSTRPVRCRSDRGRQPAHGGTRLPPGGPSGSSPAPRRHLADGAPLRLELVPRFRETGTAS
jgi:hypothetical protein